MTPDEVRGLLALSEKHYADWRMVVKVWNRSFEEVAIRPTTLDGSYTPTQINFFGHAMYATPLATYVYRLLCHTPSLCAELLAAWERIDTLEGGGAMATMTPEQLAKIQETTENMPDFKEGYGARDVCHGLALTAAEESPEWGHPTVVVSGFYLNDEALSTFIRDAKPTILELLHEIAVLRNSESVNAEEYEKRCDALQGAVAQRDAARKERDYFFALAGSSVAAAPRNTSLPAHASEVADHWAAAARLCAETYEEPVGIGRWPTILRIEVEAWLQEHGGVIG